MNKLSQIFLSAAAGSLVTLAITGSPLFAQNKPASQTTPAHPHQAGEMIDHQTMMKEMSEMMERCNEKMSNHNKTPGSEHNQHHPNNSNPSPNSPQSSQTKQ